jgi:UPF0755 protein
MAKKRVIPKPKSPKKSSGRRIKPVPLKISSRTWFITFGVLVLFVTWYITYASNTAFRSPAFYIYVYRGMDAEALADSLSERDAIKSKLTFRWMASIMNAEKIRPGMYRFEKGWGNFHLLSYINTEELRPTQLIDLAEYRSRKRTINELSKLTNTEEKELLGLLKDKEATDNLGGFTTESVYCIFRPGRYRVYKKMSAEEVLEYMSCQYDLFWNKDRQDQCAELDLTEDETVILASIVYSETKQRKEMPDIAGVYINRLHDNMKLESDPTVLFAQSKMDSRRVTNEHLAIKSDYNTYKRKGLPPGPICIVPAFVIDEVLEYDQHAYYYFCAKEDMSGTHNFAKNFTEHKANADRYRKALNKKKIYK